MQKNEKNTDILVECRYSLHPKSALLTECKIRTLF